MEKIATLEVLIGANISGFESGMNKVESRLTSIGNSVTRFGAGLTMLTAPLAAGLGASVKAATDFDSSMHNIAAVTGTTGKPLDTLSKQIRDIGTDSRYGANEAAQAFYDIAGSTTDAAVRIPLLTSAIHTAQAGQADLMGTTKALTSVMNAYGLKAEDVGYVSDTLTQTVKLGVGTMDQFAAALPNVTGTANALGIKFHKVGGMAAYLTTKGFTAGKAVTMLSSMMNALLKPNKTMQEALKKIGYETGQSAVANLGLIGTYQQLIQAGYGDEVAKITGRIEAFRGVTALTQKGADEFLTTFSEGVAGATRAAEGIQMEGAAAQFDLLKAKVEKLSIVVGDTLLPPLTRIADTVGPIVTGIADWAEKNPGATDTLVKLAGALVIVGPALGIVSTGIGLVTGAFTLLQAALLPIIIPLGLVVGLFAAYMNNTAGFRDRMNELGNTLRNAVTTAGQLVFIVGFGVNQAFNWVLTTVQKIQTAVGDMVRGLTDAIGVTQFLEKVTHGGLEVAGAPVVSGVLHNLPFGIGGILQAAGFAEGGPTGSGTGVAGVVHGGEYVVPRGGALVMHDSDRPIVVNMTLQAHGFEEHIVMNLTQAHRGG